MTSWADEDRESEFLSIGRGTYWAYDENTFKHYCVERIIIGRYCSIASGVVIMGGGEHNYKNVSTWPLDNLLADLKNPTRTYRPGADTIIGSDVWIGLRAQIKGGVSVGHGAVIGGGAVVSTDVPPYAIAAGNPATVRRFRFSPTQIENLLKISWWEWPLEQIRERRDLFYASVDEFIERFLIN